jgi:hypothetical protein
MGISAHPNDDDSDFKFRSDILFTKFPTITRLIFAGKRKLHYILFVVEGSAEEFLKKNNAENPRI